MAASVFCGRVDRPMVVLSCRVMSFLRVFRPSEHCAALAPDKPQRAACASGPENTWATSYACTPAWRSTTDILAWRFAGVIQAMR